MIISLQTHHLFGEAHDWLTLDLADLTYLQIPDHLHDQVFQVSFVNLPSTHLFEVRVSEQCPKEAFTHIGKGLLQISATTALVSVVHARNPGLHFMAWREREPKLWRHLDLNIHNPCLFEKKVLELIRKPAPAQLEQLFRLIDGQKLGQSFFNTLRTHIRRIECIRDSQYYALIDLVLKLVFLIFVQAKNWLNFDPAYLETKMELCRRRGLSIMNLFLKPLFARLEGIEGREPVPLGDLPRLGGGMFAFQQATPDIPNEWLISLYRALVSRYAFSLFETNAERRIVGIGPEILGHVFENLLIRNDRKIHGVFFTPPELAEHQVSLAFETLKNRLKTISEVRRLKVFDPTCGSGAYLVAAFREILKRRLALSPRHERYNGKLFALKREIVQENLFGLDLQPMAVRLAEVRLWLHMIQDLEITEPSRAPALPALQHHLRAGDFLHQHRHGESAWIKDWPKYDTLTKLHHRFPNASAFNRTTLLRHIHRLEKELDQYLEARQNERDLQEIREARSQQHIPDCSDMNSPDPPPKRKRPNGLPMHVQFGEVMRHGGFDLILGNPPWLSGTRIPKIQKQYLSETTPPELSRTLSGSADLSLYFLCAAIPLLKSHGHLSFLIPGKILHTQYASALRAYLSQRTRLDYLLDYGLDHDHVFKADVFPLVMGMTPKHPDEDHSIRIEQAGRNVHHQFEIPQQQLTQCAGIWPLGDPKAIDLLKVCRSWPQLSELPYAITRGVVTGAKKDFVFDSPPEYIEPSHLRPLLRGRDIQKDEVSPSQWIYYPFDEPEWPPEKESAEHQWLKRLGKVQTDHIHLGYGPKTIDGWRLIWKYLANDWCVALIRQDWIPDQTTYFMNIDSFEKAYRLYCYANSRHARKMLSLIAERGKDRCFFYYAHTCERLPIPPDLFERPLDIPSPSELFTPQQAKAVNVDWMEAEVTMV